MTSDTTFTNVCLPWLNHDYTIFPYWDDQRTDNLGWAGCVGYPGGTCGIFTSVTGSPPNRIFNIEWRAVYFSNTAQQANHELRLYEGQSRFDVIYGTVPQGNASATAGVQRDNTIFTQYFCNGTGGAASGGQSYTLQGCPTPTPTPTPTVTPTPTCTPAGTPGPWTQASPYSTPCMERLWLATAPASTPSVATPSAARRTLKLIATIPALIPGPPWPV